MDAIGINESEQIDGQDNLKCLLWLLERINEKNLHGHGKFKQLFQEDLECGLVDFLTSSRFMLRSEYTNQRRTFERTCNIRASDISHSEVEGAIRQVKKLYYLICHVMAEVEYPYILG